jgi:SpoIID/LytB domain protein
MKLYRQFKSLGAAVRPPRPLAAAMLGALLLILAAPAVSSAQEVYTFSARGTAHGVGLDMSGVEALADQGVGYREILRTYYTGVRITGGYEGEWFRIGLLNAGELQITADSPYHVYTNNRSPGNPTVRVAEGRVTRVRHQDGQYVTSVDGGRTWRAANHTWFEPDGGRLRVVNSGRRYRGLVEARLSQAGDELWAINVINIEDYVKGIAEEPNTWPTEGQRTLAVAARTYALEKKLHNPSWDAKNFDLPATGLQHYLGFDAERSNLVRAVDHTRGQVVTYNGRVIVAAYHGNSGGHTEHMENVWGGRASDYPYLRGVPSPWGRVHHWEPKTFTRAQLQDIFNSQPQSYIGQLYSIDFSDRGVSGRLRTVKLIGSAGTKELWGYGPFSSLIGFGTALIDVEAPPDNWDSFISLYNPTKYRTNVSLIFMFPKGPKQTVSRVLRPNSRMTVPVDNLIEAGQAAVKIESERPIVAERSMYFNHNGNSGGHTSLGVKSPGRRWYFAEGAKGPNVRTWLSVQNPGGSRATVTATFMPGKGRLVKREIKVPPYSVRRINVAKVSGLGRGPAPAEVTADVPVVVDRSSYFNVSGRRGGHATRGVKSPAKNWFFAEGYADQNFANRLQLFNPGSQAAVARVRLTGSDGRQVSRKFTVPARSRRTVKLNRIMRGREFGIRVTATRPVVAERAVYFNSNGRTGGHSAVGSTKPSRLWLYAEGSTRGGSEQFLTVLNLNNRPARVRVEYLSAKGRVVANSAQRVGPKSRATLSVGAAGQLGAGRAAAMRIVSNRPIVTERVMYFNYKGNGGRSTWTGGHVTAGATSPSRTWYFAEGVTQ